MEIEEILSLSKTIRNMISHISRAIYFNKKQQFFYGNKKLAMFWKNISDIMPKLSEYLPEINGEEPILDLESLLAVMQELQSAQEAKDYIMLMDLFELQLLPALVSMEERLVLAVGLLIDEDVLKKNVTWCSRENPQLLYSLLSEELVEEIQGEEKLSDTCMEKLLQLTDKCISRGVAVEPTSGGHPTLVFQKDGHAFYMHTNGNIISEAVQLADEWLAQGKEEYTFYGLGLGYAYQEMLSMDQNVSIRVFETNHDFLFYALLFAPLGNLYQTGRFELIYDPTGNKMKKEALVLNAEKGFYIFYPALAGIKKPVLKDQLEAWFMDESSVRTHFRRLDGNFKKNVRVKAKNINDLRPLFEGKEIVIVAAGPSLDKNMEKLKERKEGIVILAAGTVLKKMLNAGIRPDYAIVTDGYMTVYPQIQGIEDCGVPLIFLSTVYSKIPQTYQGDKYLLCQNGFGPAEELAERNGWQLVESGGSVMTTAFDLCLRLKAKRIIFTGLDLAYTDSQKHAKGTANVGQNVDTGIYVEAAYGGKVQTANNLKIYLEWFEKRLQNRSEEEKRIPVIDATEGGAKKRGMELMTLEKALTDF